MHRPIVVVAIDRVGIVVAARVVPPNRVWTVRSAAAMVEVEERRGVPSVGTALTVGAYDAAHGTA
jgi:hypothetical protein